MLHSTVTVVLSACLVLASGCSGDGLGGSIDAGLDDWPGRTLDDAGHVFAGDGGTNPDAEGADRGTTSDGWKRFRGDDTTETTFTSTFDIETYAPAFWGLLSTESGTLLGASHGAVWRSNDDAISWTPHEAPSELHFVGELGGGVIYAFNREAVQRSSDDGKTWSAISPAELTSIDAVTMRDDGKTFFAVNDQILSRSDDAAATFTIMANDLPDDGIVLVDRNDTIYVFENDFDGVEGIVWQRFAHDTHWYPSDSPGSISSAMALSDGTLLIGTTTGVHRSIDYADSWTLMVGSPKALTSFVLARSGRLYATDGDSVFASGDLGKSWSARGPVWSEDESSDGNRIACFVELADDTILASSERGELLLSPIVDVKIEPGLAGPAEQPATCYDGTKNGDETDVDCGSTCRACSRWRSVTDHATAEFVSSLDELFLSDEDKDTLSVSKDFGDSWTVVSTAVRILAEHEGSLYGSVGYGAEAKLLVSIDRGSSWQTFGTPTLPAHPSSLLFSQTPGRIFLGAGGNIYASDDAGASWPLFAQSGHTQLFTLTELPSGPLFAICYTANNGNAESFLLKFSSDGKTVTPCEPKDAGGLVRHEANLYVTTDSGSGLMYSKNAGASWLSVPIVPDSDVDYFAVNSQGTVIFQGDRSHYEIHSWREGQAKAIKRAGAWAGRDAIRVLSNDRVMDSHYLGPITTSW